MLKKVIFKGFKSFSDEQTIVLNNGINGIIGPNGCGKSNLIDGISFVLGAQSAKSLRGSKMTDLIFQGTAKARGAQSAEVTIVLDNSTGIFKKVENEEVSIKRKISLSGTSEYFIDGLPCRLRDVQDLFVDTGIGSDSYSIIGQDQVKKIISDKTDERRSIFEEAAGIVKLRSQKEKTEKNLKDAEFNITRIEDIVIEIEKQLKPLERQSKKAEEFVLLDDELSSLEMQYLLHEYHELSDVISKNKEKANSLIALIQNKSDFLSETEETITSLKEEYQDKNSKLFVIQDSLSSIKEKIEKHKGNISLIEEKINHAKSNIDSFDTRLNEVENEHTVSAEDFKTKQYRLTEITKELISYDEVFSTLEHELSILEQDRSNSSLDIVESRQKLVDLMNKQNKKELEKEQIEINISETKEKQNNILSKNESFSIEKKKLEDDYIEKKMHFDDAKSKIDAIDKEIFDFSTERNTLNDKKNQLSNQASSINTSIYQVTNKISSIQNFIENNEGFYDGVKAILNEKKKGLFSGVLGAVVELIKVNDNYETAYETLLQGAMQHVVTKNDSVAKEAIAYLKNNHKGRVTFLPLNMARPYTFDRKDLEKINTTKGIHSALDFVSFDKEVEPIVLSLLGRSVIADDLDIATDFMKKSGIKCRISTLDGDLVQASSLTGGGNKNKKSSLLSKQNELKMLMQELESLQLQLSQLTKQLNDIHNRSEELFEMTKVKNEELNKLRLSSTAIQNDYENAKLNFDVFNEKNKDIQLEERELTIKLSNYEKQLSFLKTEIVSIEQERIDLEYRINNNEGSSNEMNTLFEEKREEKTKLLLKINSLKEESKQLNAFMEEIGQDSDTLEEKIEKLYRSKQEELIKIETFAAEKEEEQKTLVKLERESLSVRGDIDALKKECDDTNDKINSLENSIKFDREEKQGYEKELNKINVLLSRKETEMKNNLNRLKEGYEVTEENISAFELIEIDYEKSRKRIGELRKAITSLGNVNVDSIEEYKELKDRYTTEKNQLNDIKDARKDLKILLENVETEMTNRFTTTFDAIAKGFTIAYKKLFEGGQAFIDLVEPDRPLQSEIRIVAQPPGKKQNSLNLLSGGEKSFTAVALIFAIITAKPSPFVILDEVDAALDEINVARFAEQLREHKHISQFVVITHRKGTMMATESLTGITHREPGISIVFPYSVEDREEIISNHVDQVAND